MKNVHKVEMLRFKKMQKKAFCDLKVKKENNSAHLGTNAIYIRKEQKGIVC